MKILPKTNFTLPSGEVIESVNILKSFTVSDSLKNNDSIIKRRYYDQVKRPEYISWKQYAQNTSLYWLVLMLNDFDSFRYLPKSQSRFESNFKQNNGGKVYYIKNAINAKWIQPGDFISIFAGSNWKYGGIVKEYDPILRRIILQRELENTENASEVSDFSLFRWIRTGDNWVLDRDDAHEISQGRIENEYDKTINLYDTSAGAYQLSPYVKLDGSNNPTNEYDFTDTPDSSTLIYKFCNDVDLSFKIQTYLESELIELSNTKNMKFVTTGLAFNLNSFLVTLSSQNFERGQRITINI